MIKYIKQLENRNEYYLPLIDTGENGKVNCEFKIPLSFYIENKDLFEESKNYINLFKKIDIEKYCRENSFQSHKHYIETCSNILEYESIKGALLLDLKGYEKIDFEPMSVKYLISIILRILSLLIDVYPHNKDIYIKSHNKFKYAYDKLKKIDSIIYNKNAMKYKKVFLPDSWFILPNQILYNAGDGHKGSDLTYAFYHIDNSFECSKKIKGLSKYHYDLAKEIKKNGFTEVDFNKYINYNYCAIYSDTIYNGTTHEYGATCQEKYTLNHIVGIVMAHAYFYKFFEDMQNYCLSPKEEFEKLKKLTNNELTDIFVRCCGFHKVESQLKKTITTSDVNYKYTFKEYIDNGWNIVFIPPIIIKMDLGIISELDMESPFVKKIYKKI